MLLYTIGNAMTATFGGECPRVVVRICRQGPCESGGFPPVFIRPEDAEAWLETQESRVGKAVVPLEFNMPATFLQGAN